ncbi:MAG: hypothetical protein EXR55_00375 [Dehalococcoidia bacterium]|nr:hypothetical protein [Dehalococcoidia bacterium]
MQSWRVGTMIGGWVKMLVGALILAGMLLGFAGCGEEVKGPPPLPIIYSGSVTVTGAPVPEGLRLLASVDGYESASLSVEGGRYVGLAVVPPDVSYLGKEVRFFLVSGDEKVQAVEGATFRTGGMPELRTLDLTFPRLPGGR